MSDIHSLTRKAFRLILKPLINFCVKNSITIQEIEEIVKSELVNSIKQELLSRGDKINISKVATLSGIHRRDVRRFLQSKPANYNRVGISARVISTWIYDRKFRNKGGMPKALSTGNLNSEFSQLVKNVAPEATPKTLLEHFLKSGIVKNTDNGIVLTRAGYAPDNEPEEYFEMLKLDMEDIIPAIYENAFTNPKVPNLHHTTEYTELRISNVEEVKTWILNEGSSFHHRVREYLSKFDTSVERNANRSKGDFVRVSLTTIARTSITEDF